RFRTPHNIVEEIKGLVGQFGAKKITFQDDEILCSKKRFIELCDMIHDAGLNIKMSIRTRIDSVDEEILLKCKDIGLSRISFGIESWNDDTLKKINKKYTVEIIHKSFKAIEKSGFPRISFTNICGFPWEDASHLGNNLKEIGRIPKNIPYFTVAVTPAPYPKTRLYDIYHKQYGFTDWWLDPKMNSQKKPDITEPFFKSFAVAFKALYEEDIYWNYSKKKQKEIITFSWKLFSMFVKRHYSWYESTVIIFLCRLSYVLWKRSPVLEERVFRMLESAWISKLKDRIKFVSKE
ncbi:MAG: radical SAM protein, partial [Candidatus Omnitrophica bacterium]|nr:radical SAM protein [Candidatus Omnitrophota bacterium]